MRHASKAKLSMNEVELKPNSKRDQFIDEYLYRPDAGPCTKLSSRPCATSELHVGLIVNVRVTGSETHQTVRPEGALHIRQGTFHHAY